MKPGKLTLSHLADLKSSGKKIVMVTAYDAPGARFAEQAGIDILLVGDTAGMVVLGHDGTVPVTMEEMLFLTRSVSGAVERPLIVGDMPFGSYHVSDEDAVRNAITRASKTLHNLRWFEVTQVRGHLENGTIAHWQVTVKVSFTLDETE